MPVQLKIRLVSIADAGSESAEDLLVLTKQHQRLEQLGLTLAEGKQLLREVQGRVVQQQVMAFLAAQTACPTCGRGTRHQGSHDARPAHAVRQAQLGQPPCAPVLPSSG